MIQGLIETAWHTRTLTEQQTVNLIHLLTQSQLSETEEQAVHRLSEALIQGQIQLLMG